MACELGMCAAVSSDTVALCEETNDSLSGVSSVLGVAGCLAKVTI